MTAGEHHHHQGRADSERRDYARARADSRTANCQDKEKRSDEFHDVFVHVVLIYQKYCRLAIASLSNFVSLPNLFYRRLASQRIYLSLAYSDNDHRWGFAASNSSGTPSHCAASLRSWNTRTSIGEP